MLIRTLISGASLAMLALAAHAQPATAASAAATPDIDQRETNQAARIQQGVASGQLTRR